MGKYNYELPVSGSEWEREGVSARQRERERERTISDPAFAQALVKLAT